MKSPSVSVIIPVYNAEAYLDACLDSVLSQSYADIEAIAVDDGSTDRSGAILDRRAEQDRRLVVIHQPNGGLSAARNAALAAARGEWLTFVDSDDILLPGALEAMAESAADCDIVVGKMIVAVSADQQPPTEARGSKLPRRAISGREACEAALLQNSAAFGLNSSSSGKLYSRSLWGSARYKAGTLYEDLGVVTMMLYDARRVNVIDREVYFYRLNTASILGTFTPRRFDAVRECEIIERRYAGDPELSVAAGDRLLSASFNALMLMGRHRYRDPEVEARCVAHIKRLRRATMLNPKARLRNRVGAALSYILGPRAFATPLLARFLSR